MTGDGVKTEHKAWWKSKTLWFNVLGLAQVLLPTLPIDPQMTAAVIAVGNAVLRVVTTQPIVPQ